MEFIRGNRDFLYDVVEVEPAGSLTQNCRIQAPAILTGASGSMTRRLTTEATVWSISVLLRERYENALPAINVLVSRNESTLAMALETVARYYNFNAVHFLSCRTYAQP